MTDAKPSMTVPRKITNCGKKKHEVNTMESVVPTKQVDAIISEIILY